MPLIQINADLSRVATALEQLVEILGRAFPPQLLDQSLTRELTKEELDALGFTQRSDAQSWKDEVTARRLNGETEEDIAWRSYAPRS
jgi:hypothetical protein